MYHQPSSIQQWGLHGIKPNWVSIIHHATLCSMSSTLSIHSRMVPCRIGACNVWCRNDPLIHKYKWCTSYSSCYAQIAKWYTHSQVQVMHTIFPMLRTNCKMVHSFTSTSHAHHIPHVTHTLQNDPLIHPTIWCTSYSHSSLPTPSTLFQYSVLVPRPWQGILRAR